MSNDNRKHYILNVVSRFGNTFAVSFIGMISAPISLNYWKPELYGIWAIIHSFTAYLSISGLGVDVAAGILMTKTNDVSEKKSILRKSMVLVVGSMILALTLFVIIAFLFPDWARVMGKMSPEALPIARTSGLIYIVSVFLSLPFSTISNSFQAYKKAYINNVFSLIKTILNFLILLLVVFFKRTLVEHAIYIAVSGLLWNLAKVAVYRRIVRGYSPDKEEKTDNPTSYRNVVITGMRLSFYGIAVMLSKNVGNLIISNVLEVSHVASFSLANRVVYLLMVVVMTINNSMGPLFGKEYANRNWPWIVKVHDKLFASTIILSGLLCYGCMFFLRDVISLWVGRHMDPGMPMAAFMGLWAFSYCLSNFNYVIINSFNYTKGVVLISWGELAAFAGSGIFLTRWIGVSGVPAGMFLGSLLVSLWALPLLIRKRSGDRLRYDFRLLGRVVLLVFAAAPVMYLQQTFIEKWYLRFAIGAVAVLIYVLIMFRSIPSEVFEKFGFGKIAKRIRGRP